MKLIQGPFQYGIVGLVVLALLYVVVMHQVRSIDADALGQVSQDKITGIVVVGAKPATRAELPIASWPSLANAIARSDKISFDGLKGEAWKVLCKVAVYRKKQPYPYWLVLRTRPSLHGEVLMSLRSGSAVSMYVYGDYRGARVLAVVRSRVPQMCQAR